MRLGSGTARAAAEKAATYYRERWATTPEQWKLGIRLARSHVALQQFPQAVTVLNRLPNTAPAQRKNEALVSVYLAWFAHVVDSEPDDFGKQLGLLSRALTYGSRNRRALDLLADIALNKWNDTNPKGWS